MENWGTYQLGMLPIDYERDVAVSRMRDERQYQKAMKQEAPFGYCFQQAYEREHDISQPPRDRALGVSVGVE